MVTSEQGNNRILASAPASLNHEIDSIENGNTGHEANQVRAREPFSKLSSAG
jgi:hypothetical protein